MTKIKTVTCQVQTSQLTTPFVTAKHTVNQMDSVVVKVVLENGLEGIGSATPNLVVTGDTIATIQTIIQEVLAPALVGQEIENFNALLALIQTTIVHNEPAKAAIEIALYDLRAKCSQTSLVDLLGGQQQVVKTDFTISIASMEQMIAHAQQKVAQGFTALKIKLGSASIEEDLNRVQQISTAVGPAIRLRLDANQAWTVQQAITVAKQLAKLNLPIDFIEQPVFADDIDGLKKVTDNSPIPIMADESVFSAQDALKIVSQHACNYVNIKLMKTGGLGVAEKINTICETAGVACMVGCMIESPVSIAAAVAFVASHQNVKFVDLDAVYMTKNGNQDNYLTLLQNQILLNHSLGL